MDAMPPGEPSAPEESGPTDWVAELRRQCEAVKQAAEEWAVRWQAPEGRFVTALLSAIEALGRLSASVQGAIDAAGKERRKAAEAELAQARELRAAADAALRQVRNAQASLVVEHESVTLRMIQETLPMFAERLQNVLVIREQRWNADARRKRYALAGAVALGVFLAGYGLASWQDSGLVDAFGRCLEHPLQYDKHFYCGIDGLFVPPSSPAR
jgi:hypothetical protein